jgi:hypothetical protein
MKRRVKRYADGGEVGSPLTESSTLSPWAAPYVTDVLARGQAEANKPYQAFEGPLTAGESDLQKTAFSGLANLALPTTEMTQFNPGTFTASTATQYMNPFLQASLNPQLDEARRQAEISRVEQAGRLTRSGAFGGGRQAIMESELNRNLLRNLTDVTGKGYATAYDKAMDQFNREQQLGLQSAGQAQNYGLAALDAISRGGATQRGIEQEGITADINQFREERDYDKANTQFLRNLIGQGSLPISTQVNQYQEPGTLSQIMGTGAGILGLLKLYNEVFPG